MLKIAAIPAFTDNYIWLISSAGHKGTYVVDPGDANAVIQALADHKLHLAGILITHHHFDHTGGIEALVEQFQVPVYGPGNSPCQKISHQCSAGQSINILSHEFTIMAVPGHTLDHIAYYYSGGSQDPILFCGDTLFAAGCGRLFEGSAEMMWGSLQSLSLLPAATQVYCTHEYTLANLSFAHAVEQDNKALQNRVTKETAKREQQLPTLPSTIELEKQTNPFLRCHLDSIKQPVQAHCEMELLTEVQVFSALRRWKDSF